MKLPVNIEKLIRGEVVETNRIEYKTGWNPEDVTHTMCAFANDINNLGGGYIVIGMDEGDGVPVLPPTGIRNNQVDSIQKKLLELSNLIQPSYFGISDITEIQGKTIFVLHCPGGDNRPYTAQIDVVIYQDEIGDRFSEKIFTGPIQKQLTDALEYIHTNVIRQEVV